MTTISRPRGRQVVLGFAILGGLVAAGGFFWVHAVAAAHEHPFVDSPWDRLSTSTGLTAFVIGSVVLLVALILIRVRVRPPVGGRIIWTSVWIVWVAIALNAFGTTRTTANPFDGRGAFLELLSFAVGLLTETVFLIGIAFFVLRRMDVAELDRVQSGHAAAKVPDARRPRIVVAAATGLAILGGVITFLGYFAIVARQHDYSNDADVSHWDATSIEPGITAFIIGSVALLGAFLAIRLHVRPGRGAHFVWASAWLFWLAIAVNCLGLAVSTDPRSAIYSQVILLSVVIGVAAVVFLLFGVIVRINAAAPANSVARATRDPGRSSFPVG